MREVFETNYSRKPSEGGRDPRERNDFERERERCPLGGFRSGKSGSLEKGAKAAGRAIGKRYSAGGLFQIPPKPFSYRREMWEDYRVFKAAGLLHKWREKWAGSLAIPA